MSYYNTQLEIATLLLMPYLSIKKNIPLFFFSALFSLTACTTINHSPLANTFLEPAAVEAKTLAIPSEKDNETHTKATPQDLWQQIFSLYSLPNVNNSRVQKEIDWYLKHPVHLTRVQANAAPYLYFIVNEIEQRQLPGELALLPIIESAYQPFAYSHGSAAGLWQFIPSTGKYFGLKKTWWYDGRRDVYASTQAALSYFERLSKRFDNDWLLAIAAYNAGGGTISSAIKKNRKKDLPLDYWHLNLSKETHLYVPKLLALAHIFSNSERYGIQLQTIPNRPFFQKIGIQKQTDLSRLAELADISVEKFYQLNPGFNQWATDPQGPHYVLIPSEQTSLFSSRLSSLSDSQRLKWRRHLIKKGETLSHIAQQYGTTVGLIKNNNALSKNKIRVGKQLLIPSARYDDAIYSKSLSMRKTAKANAYRKGNKLEYYVASGDSFWTIARKYQVTVKQLSSWNLMAPNDTLSIGQKLVIWDSTSPRTLSLKKKNQTIRYTIRQGDSLYLVAQKFNVSIRDLKRWNKITKKYLQPGDKIKVIVDVTRS